MRDVRTALAYLKVEVPPDDPEPVVSLPWADAPVCRSLGDGLLVMYLMDQGDRFEYVNGRDLGAAGLREDDLHAIAVANLLSVVEEEGVELRAVPDAWALFFDGNFEASLLLLDGLWDDRLTEYHGGHPAVAIPARDVLAFCDGRSPEGIASLRRIVARVWPDGDHLLSDGLFRRQERRWVRFDR
jgi:uncharacterized protein YtpQ (UPF0354 family)